MIRFIVKHNPGCKEQREYEPESWSVYDKDKMEFLCNCDREDKARIACAAMNYVMSHTDICIDKEEGFKFHMK